ncbi:hypothetical protein GCM10011444_11660 [Winogradskyella haliclonae]|uniref:Uncharacterized protein n=2 Tax=Winogradskyella haliclonae TaxID=2048558 RepID=A0ABQ2BYI1_9FLAO|nr:hypothetical protein GCM10011444_11660 [Winogradskyella haliclonae]
MLMAILKNRNEREIELASKINVYQDKISNLKINNNKTTEKKVLLTDVVADGYLLQTVFNVEL